jgi:hypothetical protein
LSGPRWVVVRSDDGQCPVAMSLPLDGTPFSISTPEPKAKSPHPPLASFGQKARSFSKITGVWTHLGTAGFPPACAACCTPPPLPSASPSLELRWMRCAGEWHTHAQALHATRSRSILHLRISFAISWRAHPLYVCFVGYRAARNAHGQLRLARTVLFNFFTSILAWFVNELPHFSKTKLYTYYLRNN